MNNLGLGDRGRELGLGELGVHRSCRSSRGLFRSFLMFSVGWHLCPLSAPATVLLTLRSPLSPQHTRINLRGASGCMVPEWSWSGISWGGTRCTSTFQTPVNMPRRSRDVDMPCCDRQSRLSGAVRWIVRVVGVVWAIGYILVQFKMRIYNSSIQVSVKFLCLQGKRPAGRRKIESEN